MAFDPSKPYEPVQPASGFNPDAPYDAQDSEATAPPLDSAQNDGATETGSTVGGVVRNVGAGLLDAAATAGNVLSDPFGNLVGKPLVTAGGFAYDALAPLLGYSQMAKTTRDTLYGDMGHEQAGTRAIDALAGLFETPKPSAIVPQGDVERFARKGTTGAAMMATGGPGAALSGAVGAISGDVAASSVPEWAKPGVELATNIAVTGGGIKTGAGTKAINVLVDALGENGRYRPEIVQRVFDRIAGKEPDSTLPPEVQKAVNLIAKRIQQDSAAGGKNIVDIYDEIIKGRAEGQPMSLADVGGRNVQKMAGVIARKPGEASEYAEATTKDRLLGAGKRLMDKVTQYISSSPSRRDSMDAITAEQKTAAAPLYAEAFKPGSLAPLERQFEGAFNDASKAAQDAAAELSEALQKKTLAEAMKSRAANDVYLNNSALRAEREAAFDIKNAEEKVAAAEAQKQAHLDSLREAQTARANGDRGGVWSPRIRQFLLDPIAKDGMKRGMEIQRIEALGENRALSLKDYALDESGNVVGVPNMRLLDAVKKGLDAILEEYRDPQSGKLHLDERGRAIEIARRAYVEELDAANPSYAPARASFAGPARLKGAMLAGERSMNWHPEDIARYVADLSDGEKQSWLVGVGQYFRDQIADGSVKAADIRKLSRDDFTSGMKDRLKAALGSGVNFEKFIDAVTRERTAFEAAAKRTGGSASIERAEDTASHNAAASAASGALHLANNNWLGAARDAFSTVRTLGLRPDPATTMQAAKMLFDPALDLTDPTGLSLLLKSSPREVASTLRPPAP